MSLYGLLLCRRILTEAGCRFPKPKHFAVIYFSGWLQKQDLDRNVDRFSAGTSLEPMCIPTAISWAGCGQEILECPCFHLLHAQPLASPLHRSEAQKAPVQTHRKFLQLFEGLGHPPPSRRKTRLKQLEFSIDCLEYLGLGFFLATSWFFLNGNEVLPRQAGVSLSVPPAPPASPGCGCRSSPRADSQQGCVCMCTYSS